MAPKRKAPSPQSSPEEKVLSGEEEKEERVAANPSPLKRNKSAQSSESEESDDEEEAEEEKEKERVAVKPSPLSPNKSAQSSESEESDDEEESEEEKEEERVAVKASPLKRNKSAQSSESEESDDEEEAEEEKEEEWVAVKPSPLKRNKSAHSSESEESDDEEEAEEKEEEKKNEPVSKPTEPEPNNATESDVEEEGEEGEEKEEFVLKPTNPVKKPESESAKKKLNFGASPSQSSGKFTRIWTYDDELALMQALSQFQSEQGRLPAQKEYGLVLNSLKRKLNPAIQEKQVINKIRALKDSHSAWKRKGTEPFSSSNPHAKALFEISIKLWGGNVEVPKKVEEPSQDVSHDEESHDEEGLETKTINGGTAIDGEQNVDGSEFPYLMDAIEELGKNDPGMLLFYKNSFEMVDKSKAGDFEAKFKKLKYNQAKLIFDKLELTNKLAKELTKLRK